MEEYSLADMSLELKELKDKLTTIERKFDSLFVALNGNDLDPDSGYLKKIKILEKENIDLKEEIKAVRTTISDYVLKAKWLVIGMTILSANSLYQIIQIIFK